MTEISSKWEVFGDTSESRELRQGHGPWQNSKTAMFREFYFLTCLSSNESVNFHYVSEDFFANFLRSADIKVGSALKRAKYSCDLTISYFPRRDE